MAKLSVIMTVLNCIDTVPVSVDSLYQQSYQDWELICIDGGSSDGTLEYITALSHKDIRVHVYPQLRPGIGAAKNCGIEHVTGKYFTFLDADDWYMDPTALEKLVIAAETHQVSICGAFRSKAMGTQLRIEKEALHRKLLQGYPCGRLFNYRDLQYDYHFHSYIYRTELIRPTDIRFSETFAYDDTWFTVRAMLKAEQIFVFPVELYCYRDHPAYDYDGDRALDVISGLLRELQLAKEYRLEKLHWLVFQRISYEYGEMLFRNAASGNQVVFDILLKANQEVDVELLEEVINNPPSQEIYVDAMIYKKIEDMPIYRNQQPNMPRYLFTPVMQLTQLPLWKRRLLHKWLWFKHRVRPLKRHIVEKMKI